MPASRALGSSLRPLLRTAALPLVYVASAAYWVVVAHLVERRLAPNSVRADRRWS